MPECRQQWSGTREDQADVTVRDRIAMYHNFYCVRNKLPMGCIYDVGSFFFSSVRSLPATVLENFNPTVPVHFFVHFSAYNYGYAHMTTRAG